MSPDVPHQFESHPLHSETPAPRCLSYEEKQRHLTNSQRYYDFLETSAQPSAAARIH